MKRLLQQRQQQTHEPPNDKPAKGQQQGGHQQGREQQLQHHRLDAMSSEQLHQLLQQLEHDLQYVLHFPKGERYVSLFKQAETPEAQQQLVAQRLRLRQLVLLQLQEAAAIAEADEGAALAANGAVFVDKRSAAALLSGSAQAQGLQQPSRTAGDLGMFAADDDFFLQSGIEHKPDEQQETDMSRKQAASHVQGKLPNQQRRPAQRWQQQQQSRPAAVQHWEGHSSSGVQHGEQSCKAAEVEAVAGLVGRERKYVAPLLVMGGEQQEADAALLDVESDHLSAQGTADENAMDISTWLEQQRRKAAPLLAGSANQQRQQKQQEQQHGEQTHSQQHKLQQTEAVAMAGGRQSQQTARRSPFDPAAKQQPKRTKEQHQQAQQQDKQLQQRIRRPGQQQQQQQQGQDQQLLQQAGAQHAQQHNTTNGWRSGAAGLEAATGGGSKPAGGVSREASQKRVSQQKFVKQHAAEKQPLRKRAEGGRKRRRKSRN